MQIVLNIIAIFAIIVFIMRLIVLGIAARINKVNLLKLKRSGGDISNNNPIYFLSCDRSLYNRAELFGEIYIIPAIHFSISNIDLEVTVSWLKWSYNVSYYYKHADD